jgi:hypothetical protein
VVAHRVQSALLAAYAGSFLRFEERGRYSWFALEELAVANGVAVVAAAAIERGPEPGTPRTRLTMLDSVYHGTVAAGTCYHFRSSYGYYFVVRSLEGRRSWHLSYGQLFPIFTAY